MSEEAAVRREVAPMNILIVDDELAIRKTCSVVAEQCGMRAIGVATAEEALEVLEHSAVDILLTDLKLPQANGVELLKVVHDLHPQVSVVVLTQYGTIESAMEVTRMGAVDYVTKPFRIEELRSRLERVARAVELQQENTLLREQLRTRPGFGGLIGVSVKMQRVYKMMEKVSQHEYPVLILGESGTGKELVARSIHFSGPRKDRPFAPVDCSALVPTLIESELFGYVKGAFTGAVQAKQGLLEAAQGGTLFLDEIGDMPVDLQAKLLRALQEREIKPVGSTERRRINVRIIAATNRDLESAIRNGAFRQDLYFRLNVVQLKLPPLRDRKSDIPLLVTAFLEKFSDPQAPVRTISEDAMRRLISYVREHGGQVHVLHPPQGGAAFQIELPGAAAHFRGETSVFTQQGRKNLLPEKPRSTPRKERPALRQASGKGSRVLVVEDEPTVGRLIADVLEDEGFDVDVLLDGREALERAARETYRLVICDMKMPGLDGQHFYESLEHAGNPLHERFLFVTGDIVAAPTQEFLRRNDLPHVAKPFRVEELMEKVHRVLESKVRQESAVSSTRKNVARNG
jgi:DNA-binding NtrC family response regulator